MQLGKLSAFQSTQELSCKTRNKPAQTGQWLTPEKQNSKPHREDRLSSIDFQDEAAAAGTLDDRSFGLDINRDRNRSANSMCSAVGSAGCSELPISSPPQTVVLIITPENRRGLFVARLDGRIIGKSRQPFVDGARQLLREGFPPEALLISRSAPDGIDCLRSTIGFAAGITIDEHNGTVFARYKPFSCSAVTSSVRFSRTAATNLAKPAEAFSGAATAEPDPPDKRRRPRMGNARAHGSLDRAAAESTYSNRLPPSSGPQPKNLTDQTPARTR